MSADNAGEGFKPSGLGSKNGLDSRHLDCDSIRLVFNVFFLPANCITLLLLVESIVGLESCYKPTGG